jgi:hypothetical protein
MSITAVELEHPNETLNRQERAFALTRLCLQYRIRTLQVTIFTEEQWNMLGEAARVNLPISQKTRDLVVDLLQLARTPVLANSSKLTL